METISGIIEPNAGEDRKVGRHILRSADGGAVFVLSSNDVYLDIFLRKFVLIVGYRSNIRLTDGQEQFIVVSVMPGDDSNAASNLGDTSEGILKLLEDPSIPYGTHALHDVTGKLLYALQSDIIKLDNYVGKPVIVKGHALAGYPFEGGPINLSVTDACIPVDSMPARKFDIELRLKNLTTHAWALAAISDRPVVELIGERLVPDDQAVDGSSGTARFLFWTSSSGRTTLTFKKSRIWESEKVLAEVKYLVVSE
ncbi:protease inhibitor I42 family protein [Azohydromonas lata]|uniref:Protease inhibitor I42 family protein n=1 Tax=Azohydromonas lata TaxID=45677 RepID=A0ABU5IKD0_9BURK|nr:protease inhibitor I42 family protein [Azohydromonas lata]MDZ5459340.1 protease inhibitor I42 family protein [Azohydromonas lata]